MVVGAHPDDETLGCGGAIARRLSEGHEVVVVVLTRGERLYSAVLGIDTDPTPEELGRIRREETRQATRILGVHPGNLVFLDYGDGSLAVREAEAARDLAMVLRERRPAEVWSLSDYEHHTDHAAVARIVRSAMEEAGGGARLLYYVISLRYDVTPDAVPLDFKGVDISAHLAAEARGRPAVPQPLGHALARAESGPCGGNADNYLHPEELFAEGRPYNHEDLP